MRTSYISLFWSLAKECIQIKKERDQAEVQPFNPTAQYDQTTFATPQPHDPFGQQQGYPQSQFAWIQDHNEINFIIKINKYIIDFYYLVNDFITLVNDLKSNIFESNLATFCARILASKCNCTFSVQFLMVIKGLDFSENQPSKIYRHLLCRQSRYITIDIIQSRYTISINNLDVVSEK